MADDTLSVDNVNAGTTAFGNLNDAIEDGNKELQKFNKVLEATTQDTEKGLKNIIKYMGKLTKTFGPAIREFDKFGEIAEATEKGVKSLDKAFSRAFFAGNKQGMLALSVIKQQGDALAAASREAKVTSDRISDLSGEYRKTTIAMLQNRMEMEKVQKAQDDLNESIRRSGGVILPEQEDALKKNTELLGAYEASLIGDAKEAQRLELQVKVLTEKFKENQQAVLTANRELISNAEQLRANNREVRKFAGGWTGVSAAFEDVMDTKFFEYLKKGSSTFFVAGGAAMLMKGLSQTAEHAQAVSRIALSLGDTSQVGLGRMTKSAKEASDTVNALTLMSVELGYSFDDLVTASNKVRAGIRMDRDGQLGEEAIQNMTREAAYFARVSGMDLANTVGLLETRIKRYGMSNAQATASLYEMRTTLMQMTAGAKDNTIVMGDMVNIIEEASAASQSYIVDTRIMTQAIRGAVNQAEHLGAAQKQAKDVAVGVGKILSNAPDFIKIPAGFDLVHQLVGGDSDKLLMELDAGTRKQAVAIQQALKTGKLDYYVGAKVLMDLIGQTEAGIEAQSKQLEKTILQGPVAVELIAEQYEIENRATAFLVTTMMKEAVEMRNKMGRANLGFAPALVKDTALVDNAIKTLSKAELPSELLKFGLNENQVDEYVALYKKGKDKEIEIDAKINELRKGGADDAAEQIAALETKKYEETIKARTLKLQEFKRPVQALTKMLTGGKPWDITAKISPKSLIDAQIKSGKELARRIGIDYEKADGKTRSRLAGAFTESGAMTSDEMESLRLQNLEIAKAMDTGANKRENALRNPVMAIWDELQVIGTKLNVFGPGGLMLGGVLGIGAGIALLYRGQQRNLYTSIGLLDRSKVIYKDVRMALLTSGKPGGGGGGGGGYGGEHLPGETTEDRMRREEKSAKQSQNAEKQARIRREAEIARANRQTAKSLGHSRGLKDAAGGLLKEGRYLGGKVIGDTAKWGMSALKSGGKRLLPAGLSSAATVAMAYPELSQAYKQGDKRALATGVGGLIGGMGGFFGGGALGGFAGGGVGAIPGAIAGGYGGEKAGEAIAGGLYDFFTSSNAGVLPGTRTSMPELKPVGAKRPGGYASLGGGAMGGGLMSDVGMHSLTPDGALTLKIRGFQELTAQLNKVSRENVA